MVTGDNILTAVSVARECGLLHSQEVVLMVGHTKQVGSQVQVFTTSEIFNLVFLAPYYNHTRFILCGPLAS